MKAVIYEQNGGIEELKVRDMPDPENLYSGV